jgi:hypothetical protein
MSAADSGTAFNLQCLVREEMMDWVREHYPTAFPTTRFAAAREGEGEKRGAELPPPQKSLTPAR